jgi:2-polyprenyl-6-hydroxyphenyl methylase/3-demethylubiquinone-9 3-methyltransferase
MTNIDATEIRRFNRQAGSWWDPGGDCKALHDINPLRIHYINSRCSLWDKKILDAGCGGGILSEAMAVQGGRVTGIDMGEGPIEAARAHRKLSGLSIEYLQTTPEELARSHVGRFDIVTCMELLEHVPDPQSVVGACGRLSKPGGDVFFSTINRNPKAFLFAIMGAEWILRLLPRGSHAYQRLIRPEELETWAQKADLAPMHRIGLQYNPFSRKYRLGGGLDVNYMVHCKKMTPSF